MDNIINFETARKRGGQLNTLSDEDRMARNEALREARKARILASVPGDLDTLPDNYPLSFDMLLPVCGLTYSRGWIYQMIRIGRFPSNVKVGENRIAWLAGDIRRYMAKRAKIASYKMVSL